MYYRSGRTNLSCQGNTYNYEWEHRIESSDLVGLCILTEYSDNQVDIYPLFAYKEQLTEDTSLYIKSVRTQVSTGTVTEMRNAYYSTTAYRQIHCIRQSDKKMDGTSITVGVGRVYYTKNIESLVLNSELPIFTSLDDVNTYFETGSIDNATNKEQLEPSGMWTVEYRHRGSDTINVLYSPSDANTYLCSASLHLEVGKAGSFTFTIPETAKTPNIQLVTDEIIVKRDNEVVFRGRPVTEVINYDLTKTITCEGLLDYLCDTVFYPFDYSSGDGVTVEDFLREILQNHNKYVDADKKIGLGTVDSKFSLEKLYISSEEYLNSFEAINSRVIDAFGGYLIMRHAGNDKNYLDYLSEYSQKGYQTMTFGENIIDIAQEIEYADLVTAILPLGKKSDKTGKYVTVASVNDNSLVVKNNSLYNKYGFICEVVNWENVTKANNLLTKATNYANNLTASIASMSVNAVDLNLIDKNTPHFYLGDYIRINSTPHGVSQTLELLELEIDLFDPNNDIYTFGNLDIGLSSRIISERNKTGKNLQTNEDLLHKINGNYITKESLIADNDFVNQLFAKDITSTGTITGARLLDSYFDGELKENGVKLEDKYIQKTEMNYLPVPRFDEATKIIVFDKSSQQYLSVPRFDETTKYLIFA